MRARLVATVLLLVSVAVAACGGGGSDEASVATTGGPVAQEQPGELDGAEPELQQPQPPEAGSEPAPPAGEPPRDGQDCPSGHVALTFDDGPHPQHTPELLDLLDELEVPAVFFVNGNHVEAHPEITAETAARGHVIANHTYAHEDLTELSEDDIVETLRRTDEAVARAGADILAVVRPPWGLADEREESVMDDHGYVSVTWDFHVWDWEWPAGEQVEEFFARLDGTANVLLHDGVVNSPETIRAVGEIVPRARAEGWCFGVLDAEGEVAPAP